MAPQQVFSLKDNDDTAHIFGDRLMCSLASLHGFLFVNKSSVYICNKQIHGLKRASQLKGPSNKAGIKVCQVGNTHFVPSRLTSLGEVRHQERWKWVRGIKRGILAATEFHNQKLRNTFYGWILFIACLLSGRFRKSTLPAVSVWDHGYAPYLPFLFKENYFTMDG